LPPGRGLPPAPGDAADSAGERAALFDACLASGRRCLPDCRPVTVWRMDIVILLFDRFEPLDAIGPYEILAHVPGAKVRFVAPESGRITDVLGTRRRAPGPGPSGRTPGKD
jgi:hypothetical protein